MGQFVAAAVADNGIRIAHSPIFNSRYASVPVVLPAKPELRLLLIVANVELPAGQRSLLQECLTGTVDWEYLLRMAKMHGLEPLLFHHLHCLSAEVVPHGVMQTLRDNCRLIALRNLLLSAKLREISAHLTSLHIEHIAYKGPLLAEIYGGDGALRTYRDLDLLVSQEQLGAVRDALRDIGFVDRYGLTEAQQAISFRSGFEHSFTSRAGIDLDVHWRIVQEFKSCALDMDGVWARRTLITLLGQDVPGLSPEDLLVVLCLHAGHHGWTQLSHLCDLAQLFRVHENFDWQVVRGHLGDSNTRRIVCVSLRLLEMHWHVDIPKEIGVLISADPYVDRLAHRIEVEIWPVETPTLTTANLRWLLDRSAGEGLRDRMRLLVGSIFVPAVEDLALFRLPPALSPLYPGLRALRLTWRYVSSLWQTGIAQRMATMNSVHDE